MVIINSSGGVLDQVEGYYARELVKHGIAALVVTASSHGAYATLRQIRISLLMADGK
jgi:hypothetical protein